MPETFGYNPDWTSGLGGLPREERAAGPGGLIGLPILQNYLAYGQILDAQEQRKKALAEQDQFKQERAAIGPGSQPEDYARLALRYGGPQDLLRYADDYQKIIEARKAREAQQQAVERIMGGGAAQSAPVELGVPGTDVPRETPNVPSGVRDVSDRLDQLKKLSVVYAGNPAAVTAINREIDKLEATPKSEQPSVHLKQDKTSPTGWSWADVKTDKILSKGAPPPSSQEVQVTNNALRSQGAQVATGMPLSQVVSSYGRGAAQAKENARQEGIRQIKEQNPGMTDEQAGTELANRQIDYVAGRRSTTQLNLMLGSTRQAVDQLDFNVKKTSEAMDKLKTNDVLPVVNAISRGVQKWTGDPAYAELFFYMHASAMESARILQGGQASIAQLHQGAAEEAKKWASANWTTPKAWKEGVAPAMMAEGQARIDSFTRAIEAQKLKGSSSASPTSAPPITATGPNGEKIMLKDGKWVPVR